MYSSKKHNHKNHWKYSRYTDMWNLLGIDRKDGKQKIKDLFVQLQTQI